MLKVRTETLFIHLIYIFISVIISIYLIGFNNLNPFNLDWLLTNDQVGELIGWLDYKNSKFSFPLGNFEKPGFSAKEYKRTDVPLWFEFALLPICTTEFVDCVLPSCGHKEPSFEPFAAFDCKVKYLLDPTKACFGNFIYHSVVLE